MKECPIFAKESVLKKYYEELHALPSFNIVKKEGIFKYVVIRGTGDDFAMIFCCTSQGKEYVSQLLDKFCDVPNIALTIVDGISDISMGETTQVIKGNNYYFENIGDCKFKVPLNGFIQPNPTQANELYSFVKSLVVGDELVDLFCGVGSIGIYCKPKTLYGVEVVKEAVEVAVENAKLNGVDNAHFSCVDLYKIEESDIPGNLPTIIVDPPREGLHKKTIKALLAKKCRKLIYVSCNPNSAKDNLDKLSAGFDIVSIKGFDMFPHTPHVEVVIELTPKDL